MCIRDRAEIVSLKKPNTAIVENRLATDTYLGTILLSLSSMHGRKTALLRARPCVPAAASKCTRMDIRKQILNARFKIPMLSMLAMLVDRINVWKSSIASQSLPAS